MNTRRLLLVLLSSCLVTPRIAHAGAWSHESFANDGALDWIAEFRAEPTEAFLKQTLSLGTKGGYIENYTGESIIAAAEIVAASLGRPTKNLPTELQPLIARNKVAFSKLAPTARQALLVVMGPKSELREIWGERADGLARWRSSVNDLIKRLQ